jgi:hypothetical protein
MRQYEKSSGRTEPWPRSSALKKREKEMKKMNTAGQVLFPFPCRKNSMPDLP